MARKEERVEEQAERANEELALDRGFAAGGNLPVEFDPFQDELVTDTLDTRRAFLKIAYPGSADRPNEAGNGQLYNNVTGAFGDTFRVLLLAMGTVRNSWRPVYDADNPTASLCESDNGIVPCRGSGQLPGPCREKSKTGKWVNKCPKLEWSGSKKKWVAPECATIYPMLLWDIDRGGAVIFNVKRKGSAIVSRIKLAYQGRAQEFADKKHPNIPMTLRVPFELGTESFKTYFLPTFKLLVGEDDRIPAAEAMEIIEMLRDLKKELAEMSTADLTETSGGSDGA